MQVSCVAQRRVLSAWLLVAPCTVLKCSACSAQSIGGLPVDLKQQCSTRWSRNPPASSHASHCGMRLLNQQGLEKLQLCGSGQAIRLPGCHALAAARCAPGLAALGEADANARPLQSRSLSTFKLGSLQCCRNVELLHAQVDEDFSKQVGFVQRRALGSRHTSSTFSASVVAVDPGSSRAMLCLAAARCTPCG